MLAALLHEAGAGIFGPHQVLADLLLIVAVVLAGVAAVRPALGRMSTLALACAFAFAGLLLLT